MPVFRHGSRGGPEVVHERVLTVPNLISAVRILVLPLVYLDIVGGREGRALVLVALIAGSDFIDGYVARRFDQVSRLGQLLDPISDRLLVVVVGVAMIVAGILPLWIVVVVVARDVVVVVGGLLLLARGLDPPAVTDLGKAATFGLLVTLPIFLLAAAVDSAQLHHAAWVGLVSFTLLYYLSAGQYALSIIGELRGR